MKTSSAPRPTQGWLRSALPARAWVGFAGLSTIVALSLAAPLIAPHGASEILSPHSFAFPPEAALFGTDYLGRDLLSRLLYGGRFTLLLALLATCLAFLIGVGAGVDAALAQGQADEIMSRTVDSLLSFPAIIFALLAIHAFGTELSVLVVIVAVIEACRVFRVARALALDIAVLDYVEAARARGEGLWWLAVKEVLPNITGPLAAEFGLRFTYVILFISALSFIGLGVQPPTADWGVMVRENAKGLIYGSPAPLFPAACIAVVTISANLIVDAVIGSRHEARIPEMLP